MKWRTNKESSMNSHFVGDDPDIDLMKALFQNDAFEVLEEALDGRCVFGV
jgi:hypothetical protein